MTSLTHCYTTGSHAGGSTRRHLDLAAEAVSVQLSLHGTTTRAVTQKHCNIETYLLYLFTFSASYNTIITLLKAKQLWQYRFAIFPLSSGVAPIHRQRRQSQRLHLVRISAFLRSRLQRFPRMHQPRAVRKNKAEMHWEKCVFRWASH